MPIDEPTVERKNLSEAKRNLLAQRLRGTKGTGEESERIQPAPAGTRKPLSPGQYRIWLHASSQPDLPTYNEPITLEYRGHLDFDLLEASLNRFLQRHEAWRTSFAIDQEDVLQIVHSDLRVKIARVDLSELPEIEREAEAQRLAIGQAASPIGLTEAPLLRFLAVRMAADLHRLYLVVHHIIFDGISIQRTFIPELAAIYAALEAGSEPALPQQRLQYWDYTYWRLRHLDSPAMEAHVEYWRTALAGELPVLRLPADRPRPAVISQRGSMERFIIPRELTDSLRELGQAQGATLYMTLLAAFKVLLFRYSGQEDIIVGGVADARRRPELNGMMGYFLDTYAVRTHPSSRLSFSAYLNQVKSAVVGALVAADVPFERITQATGIKRDLSYHPIFQACFSLQPPAAEFPPGWDRMPMDTDVAATKFDLHFESEERQSHTSARISYSTDLFDAGTIRRMAGHWLNLLEAIRDSPDCPLGQLEFLTALERHQLLYEWNTIESEFPSQLCIHELFEERARKTPENIAVVFEKGSLSYGELNRRANQLAHFLRGLGVGPDTRVALCVERSLEMIVGLLAVLKAGGAYVPLDPAYPADRLRFVLEDSAPAVLLTQSHLRNVFSGSSNLPPVLELDAKVPAWTDQPHTNPDAASIGLSSKDLAYIIYTSGSTGAPKGVMVEHRNVARLFTATAEWFKFNEKDVWTLFHSYAFDFSVWEIWGALCHGGRLVIVPRNTTRSPEDFYKLICEAKVTILNQTPSAFRQLIAAQGASKRPHRLRYVIFGGEALEVSVLKPWYEQNSGQPARLVNMYGITETTVHVTYRPLESADANRHGASPIGCRIPDLRIYILDSDGSPMPIGVPGELYVGGAGVARGYLNRPELTAARFLPNPFCGEASARMYKSGDLGRWLPDGNIEFLGRNDFQVKIRGFRIELGEIEARLAEYPGIRDAIVIAREDGTGDKRLVAYYTAQDKNIGSGALRPYLAEKLPDYMVPAAYVRLESLPLTPNGKLDRQALPAPNLSAPRIISDLPMTDEEQRLAKIWAEVLGVDGVGRNDNFFALGGHSLLLVRLFARLNKEFKSDLPITTIFDTPTLSALAEVLRDNARISSVAPVQTSGSKPPLFMVHSYLIYHALSGALGKDQPFYGLRELPRDEKESIEERARRYIGDMRRVQQRGPYRIAGWCAAGPLTVELARQLVLAGDEVALIALFDSWLPEYERELKLIAGRQPYTSILASKLAYHKGKLHGRSAAAGAKYLWGACRRMIVASRDRFYVRYWRAMTRLSKRLNIPVPQFMHNTSLQTFASIREFRAESFPAHVTLIRALDSRAVEGASASNGWEKIAELGVTVLFAPGDHESMFQGSNLKVTASLMREALSGRMAPEQNREVRPDASSRAFSESM